MDLPDRRWFNRAAMALPLVMTSFAARTSAQQRQAVPGEAALEILVKHTLLTFNDANLTGNYSVFYATLSEQFRRQFPLARLQQAFAAFHDQQIDLAGIIIHKYILTRPAAINADGSLEVVGRFDTRPLNVFFSLTYAPAGNEEWRILGLNINVAPPEGAGSAGGPTGPQRSAKGNM